jgi:hypothetical protein
VTGMLRHGSPFLSNCPRGTAKRRRRKMLRLYRPALSGQQQQARS